MGKRLFITLFDNRSGVFFLNHFHNEHSCSVNAKKLFYVCFLFVFLTSYHFYQDVLIAHFLV